METNGCRDYPLPLPSNCRQPVTVEDTISILRGLKEKYEVHHGIRISDSAIVSAAQLSNRYITDRFLPDKAIDVLDEVGAKIKIKLSSPPPALAETEAELFALLDEPTVDPIEESR